MLLHVVQIERAFAIQRYRCKVFDSNIIFASVRYIKRVVQVAVVSVIRPIIVNNSVGRAIQTVAETSHQTLKNTAASFYLNKTRLKKSIYNFRAYQCPYDPLSRQSGRSLDCKD